jgi:hypothetical protein
MDGSSINKRGRKKPTENTGPPPLDGNDPEFVYLLRAYETFTKVYDSNENRYLQTWIFSILALSIGGSVILGGIENYGFVYILVLMLFCLMMTISFFTNWYNQTLRLHLLNIEGEILRLLQKRGRTPNQPPTYFETFHPMSGSKKRSRCTRLPIGIAFTILAGFYLYCLSANYYWLLKTLPSYSIFLIPDKPRFVAFSVTLIFLIIPVSILIAFLVAILDTRPSLVNKK